MAMRKYVPCDRDREIVQHMSAIPGVAREQIAYVITNERTGKPINRRTLEKHFGKELETGMAVMQKITMQSFVEQIQTHVWPATRLALNNYCGLKDNGDIAINANVDNNLNVTFVASPHSREPNEPLPGPLPADARVALPPPIDVPITPHISEPVDTPVAPHRLAEPEVVEVARTEFDLTNAERDALGLPHATPWHKRKSRGRPFRGPLVWCGAKKRTGWLG